MKSSNRNGSARKGSDSVPAAKASTQSKRDRESTRGGAVRARKASELRLPAIEVKQGPKRTLYSFAIDGKTLSEFTTVSRVRRPEASAIEGYQRPEVLSHISEIRDYLETNDPMIPNAVVVAFDGRVRFEPTPSGTRSQVGFSRLGTLIIPVHETLDEADRPGWVVDGQQRIAAIRAAKIESFPICVVAFITDDEQMQREQFILVNSTKPLPKGLIYELLPSTETKLPSLLNARRFPALLLDHLNHDPTSPLYKLIRTPTVGTGLIKDNSVLKMLENSLSDGVLYRFRGANGDKDIESMLRVLHAFWGATSQVFNDAWGISPRRSRLMHGAGIVSFGFVMDAIADRYRRHGIPDADQFRKDLEPLREVCRWTDGYWDFGPGIQRKWNEIQNTPKDIQTLANYLLVQYKSRVWNRANRG
jgi:DGQHR domain-containing protein